MSEDYPKIQIIIPETWITMNVIPLIKFNQIKLKNLQKV